MSSSRQTILWARGLGFVLVFVYGQLARAQQVEPEKAAAAQAIFEQAMADMDAQHYASACKKFEEVTRLVPEGPGGKYMLGECYEKLGKLASAWAHFSFAFQLADRFGQTERANDAKMRAEALRPKLATLTITMPENLRAVPNISVRRGDVDLRDPQWGTPIYVDSGQHEIEVTAPGYTTWKKRVEVLTDGVQVKLVIPEGAIQPQIKTPSKDGVVAPVVIMVPPPDTSWRRPAGITATIGGAAMLVTGSILGGMAIGKKNESNDSGHCLETSNKCDDAGLTLRKDAVGFGNASTGLFIAGAAMGVVGVVLWATAPKRTENKSTPTNPDVSLHISPQNLNLRLSF